jgi:putative tryptophan/tyrosine transport system substrate-binding protein
VKGCEHTGYVEGQNSVIEYRWSEGDYDRLPALAADLVGRKVDVIVTQGGPPSALAAKSATATIPIVFHTGADPIADGLVASLSRPGGNITGFSLLTVELTAKRLELVLEVVPQATVITLLVNPKDCMPSALFPSWRTRRAQRGSSSMSLRPAAKARSTLLSRP